MVSGSMTSGLQEIREPQHEHGNKSARRRYRIECAADLAA
jgi:hypothetical protein